MLKPWILLFLLFVFLVGIIAFNAHTPDEILAQEKVVLATVTAIVPSESTDASTIVPTTSTPSPIIDDNVEQATVVPMQTAVSTKQPLPPTSQSPPWLNYLNQFRRLAGLPLLIEDPALTYGSQLHSEYMDVLDDPDARYQSSRSYYYSEEGDMAARNANIFAMTSAGGNYDTAINFWMSAPFNIVPILDPQLQAVGFGYEVNDEGNLQLTAVLDVNSGVDETIQPQYPLTFPQDGGKTWLYAYGFVEYPYPLTVCDNYQQPTGPPLVLQLGSGSLVPDVTAYSFKRGDQELEACVLHESNYLNGNGYAREMGRSILDARDAIVIIPKRPLTLGNTYTVSVIANEQQYEWSFTTVTRPESTLPVNPQYEPSADMSFIWPVTNHDVYTRFWYKHTGLDLLMPQGSPIVASEDGTVIFRGWDERGYGNTIQLSHGDGVRTLYGHMDSFNVRQGDVVKQGDVIGFVGNTGNSDLPHVHFEILFNYYRPVDPCDYLMDIPQGVPLGSWAEQDAILITQGCGQKMVLGERP